MPSPNEPRRFVILAAPRTGSNALCSLLQSHSDVLCHHEVFNPAGAFLALPLRDTAFSLGPLEERERDPMTYLSRIWRNNLNHRVVGFKMTHRQNPSVFEAVCEDPAISKIVLRRRGGLRTYVSRLIAEQTGVWESYGAVPEATAINKVSVDYQKLIDAVAYNAAYYAELEQRARGPCLSVEYEKLFDPKQQAVLLDFLKLPQQPLRCHARRQNPQSLACLVGNTSELARRLKETPGTRVLYEELIADQNTR